MEGERKFTLSNTCFRCKRPVVEMTDQESREKFGDAPITAIIKEHYITPWGVACPDCVKQLCHMWGQYTRSRTTDDIC